MSLSLSLCLSLCLSLSLSLSLRLYYLLSCMRTDLCRPQKKIWERAENQAGQLIYLIPPLCYMTGIPTHGSPNTNSLTHHLDSPIILAFFLLL